MSQVNIDSGIVPRSPQRTLLGRLIWGTAKGYALVGGACLIGLALMSCGSILGRLLWSQPLNGDYELVQVLSAAAIALFLPWCQLQRAHVRVDFFTTRLSRHWQRRLEQSAYFLLTLAASILTWRTAQGLLDLRHSGDTTMLLSWPLWYGYIPLTMAFLLLAITSFYTVFSPAIDPTITVATVTTTAASNASVDQQGDR